MQEPNKDWVIVCERHQYLTQPMTYQEAEERLAAIKQDGHCKEEHLIASKSEGEIYFLSWAEADTFPEWEEADA